MSTNADFKALNLANSGRAVWLVKVPKYINSRWEEANENTELGKLQISKLSGQKPQLSLSLSDHVLASGVCTIPKTYKLAVSVVARETVGYFSSTKQTSGDEQVSGSQKLLLEGRIVQKLECQSIANKLYMDMKIESIRQACIPKQKVQSLERAVNNFKPISDHKHNIEYNNKMKSGGKKSRADKEKVLDMLFSAFEKHQYHNIKDLVNITKQPIPYLKEILKEVCDYNMKNPHKNTWELKKQYRHYQVQNNGSNSEAGCTAVGSSSDSDE